MKSTLNTIVLGLSLWALGACANDSDLSEESKGKRAHVEVQAEFESESESKSEAETKDNTFSLPTGLRSALDKLATAQVDAASSAGAGASGAGDSSAGAGSAGAGASDGGSSTSGGGSSTSGGGSSTSGGGFSNPADDDDNDDFISGWDSLDGISESSSYDPALFYVTISKHSGIIDATNVSKFFARGTCKGEGDPVEIGFWDYRAANVICRNGLWEVNLDLTTLYRDPYFSEEKEKPHSLWAVQVDADGYTHYDMGYGTVRFFCPPNFIPVPALPGYTEKSFCVSKYEMKSGPENRPVSQASGKPTPSGNVEGITYCQALNANAHLAKRSLYFRKDLHRQELQGYVEYRDEYDLISNEEWQALARNIEGVGSNWSTGRARSGILNVGNAGVTVRASLEASIHDSDPCFQTGSTCSDKVWHIERRTHTLSNGEVIWDLGGNMEENVRGEHRKDVYGPSAQISQITYSTHPQMVYIGGTRPREYSYVDLFPIKVIFEISRGGPARRVKDHFGPTGDYTHLGRKEHYGGLGKAEISNNWVARIGITQREGEIQRGGNYWYRSYRRAGIFRVILRKHFFEIEDAGYRCVFHPGLTGVNSIDRWEKKTAQPPKPTSVDINL